MFKVCFFFLNDSPLSPIFKLAELAATLVIGMWLVNHLWHPQVWTVWSSPGCLASNTELAHCKPLINICWMNECKKWERWNSVLTFLSKGLFYLSGSFHYCEEGGYSLYLKPQTLWCPEKDRSKLSFSSLPDLLNARATNTSTFTFQLWNQPPQIRAAVTEVKKSHPVVVRPKKKVEIDTEWIQSTIKVSMAAQWCFYFVHGWDTHIIRELSKLTYNVNTIRKMCSTYRGTSECVDYRQIKWGFY